MILELIATASIKPSPTPSQINTKPHTKAVFISVPIINFIISGVQKKKKKKPCKGCQRQEKMQSEYTKQTSQPDSYMRQMLEL